MVSHYVILAGLVDKASLELVVSLQPLTFEDRDYKWHFHYVGLARPESMY